jgi:transcriptional regulator with XRE-family HTH domain
MSRFFIAKSNILKSMNKFAERLREVLQNNGISQRELARKINMSQGVVNNYCTGHREPTLNVICLICKTLDESADYLLGLVD